MTFAPFQGGAFEVFPLPARRTIREKPSVRRSRPSSLLQSALIVPRRKRLCLSWDSSRFRPSIDLSSRPLPLGPKASLRPACCHTARFVPLPWFFTTSAAYSATEFAGLFRPAANHEVHRVSPSLRPLAGRSQWARACDAPRDVLPFEEFPSSTAVPHHCGRCPPDVATRRTGRCRNNGHPHIRGCASPRGLATSRSRRHRARGHAVCVGSSELCSRPVAEASVQSARSRSTRTTFPEQPKSLASCSQPPAKSSTPRPGPVAGTPLSAS